MSGRRRRRQWPRWAEVLIGAVCSVGFLVGGIWTAYDTSVLASRGVVVVADVITEIRGKTSYVEVEFTTASGERIRGETSNYHALHGAPTLEIVYDPEDPARLQAADWGFDYVGSGLLLVGATLMTWLTVHTARYGTPTWLRRD